MGELFFAHSITMRQIGLTGKSSYGHISFSLPGTTIMAEPPVDTDRIDEAVLALMYLTLHHGERPGSSWWAWKSFDWSSLDRLHDKGLILDPVGKAKSVALTDEGHRRCEEAFRRLFTKPD